MELLNQKVTPWIIFTCSLRGTKMVSNIEDYRNQDLMSEVERRIRKGSQLLDLFPETLSTAFYPGMNDRRPKLRQGSKRSLALKYHFKDEELVWELTRRFLNGEKDAYYRFKLMQKKLQNIIVFNAFSSALRDAKK